MSNAWTQILERVAPQVGKTSFATWFQPVQFEGRENGTVTVRVPNLTVKDWIEENYARMIQSAGATLDPPVHRVIYVVPETVVFVRQQRPPLRVLSDARRDVERIKRVIAAYCGVTIRQFQTRSNSHLVVFPRQVAMWLARELTPLSLPAIAREFGDKHHSTVVYACRCITARASADASFRTELESLKGMVQR